MNAIGWVLFIAGVVLIFLAISIYERGYDIRLEARNMAEYIPSNTVISKCPHCGHAARLMLTRVNPNRAKEEFYKVKCVGCGSQTDDLYLNPEEAIIDWNMRVTDDE